MAGRPSSVGVLWVLLIGWILLSPAVGAGSDPAEELADLPALADRIVQLTEAAHPIRLGIGRFERLPERVEDPLAYEIHHELARLLSAEPGIELVARAILNARQLEGRSSVEDALAPGRRHAAEALPADVLITGTLLADDHGYRLLVDIVEVATGRLRKASAWIDGDASFSAIDREIAERSAGRATIREIDAIQQAMPQDFRLGLQVGGDGRHAYDVGEVIEYHLRSERDAHVAVICHEHRGVSYPLLPNHWSNGSFFAAGVPAAIHHAGGFEIVAATPGIDVIQAIACERKESIDRFIESFGGTFDGEAETPFLPSVDRQAVLADWRSILREPTRDRCASTTIRILVSDPPPVQAIRVSILGLDGAVRRDVAAALEATPGIDALTDLALVEGVWSLEVSTSLPSTDLERLISDQLPSSLELLEQLPRDLRFGPPAHDRLFERICFLCAALFALVRWLTN